VAELWEYTKLIRSKNAGPFELTFDIMFKERSGYDLVLKSGKLSPRSIASLYHLKENEVRFFAIEQILAFKISIPRKIFSGDVQDTDLYGGQFHGPLVRLRIDGSDSPASSGTNSV
jgi:hypothetical protein